MAQLPTGTVTFLFSDIEGSTQLLQRLGDDYARVLGEHQALLRAAWAAHAGVEVDTQGDSFFVAFPAAPAAVAAAADATRALAAYPWPASVALQVRIGLHTGTPQLVGDHYVGLDIHRAARIAAAAHGGQVLLSQTTRDLAAHDVPAGATLREVGAHRLKDLREPELLYQLVLPGLPADFPPLKTLDTYQHNLPIQPTPLLGREDQVAAVRALLQRAGVRLVTLTGPGGIGKTRLAVQVAAELVDDYPDGVWFVRLSRLTDPALVPATIAQTLGLQERGIQPIADTLRAHLAARRLLLVLDNFEQVVGAAPEVAALLAASPGLTVLVTSRLPLHLRAERVYAVPPLPLAAPRHLPPLERLAQYAAVALFVERAQAARSDFAVTSANAPAVAEICARLDGLPRAIELAAARVRVLPPEALLGRLSAQLKLLTGGARDLEERQQTMRAAIAWSEALLTPDERVLFRRLAVFVGGATLEAAEAVCSTPPGADALGIDVLDGLSTLVDQSLVQQREEGGEARFGLLHTIREYALERLEAAETDGDRVGAAGGRPAHQESPSVGAAGGRPAHQEFPPVGAAGDRPEAEALRRAHAAYYLALAERAEPMLTGPEQAAWLARLEDEHDNLRAALGWARARGEAETELRLVAALGRFWRVRGHLREGRTWVEALLAPADGRGSAALGAGAAGGAAGGAGGADDMTEAAANTGLWARALSAGGSLALWQGDYAAARPWLEEAAARARAAENPQTAAQALNVLGILAKWQGYFARSAARLEESLALMRQMNDQRGVGVALGNLGDLAMRQGDLERAAAVSTEALAVFRRVGDRGSIAVVLINLGWVARARGEVARAEALGREALAVAREVGEPRKCAEALEQLVATAGAAGRGVRAARLAGAAATLRESLGAPQPPEERADMEEAVAPARADLGEDAWAAAYAAGRALSLDEAIAEALDETLGEKGAAT